MIRYPTNLPESSALDQKYPIIGATWLYNSFQKGESSQMSGSEPAYILLQLYMFVHTAGGQHYG